MTRGKMIEEEYGRGRGGGGLGKEEERKKVTERKTHQKEEGMVDDCKRDDGRGKNKGRRMRGGVGLRKEGER